MVPSCHISESASKHVTVQDRMLYYSVIQINRGRMNPLAVRVGNKQIFVQCLGAFPSTNSGGGTEGSQLFPSYNLRAAVPEHWAQQIL